MSPHLEVLRLFAGPFPRPAAEADASPPPAPAASAPVATGAESVAETTRSTP